MSECGHNVNVNESGIIKRVIKTQQLDAWESLKITNTKSPLMNREDPPILSALFNLVDLFNTR